MSNPDPPVPALGALDTAIRARLDEGARGDAPIVYLRMEDFHALLAAYDAQAARLAAWQAHLLRVHRVACDYPFRTDLPEDYAGAVGAGEPE